MLLIDHILQSNLFPLQHLVKRRGAILEALYRIYEGFWFNPAKLVMTSLFHFEDKVHYRNLTRAESIPLLFPRLLCQVLEHIGFPAKPRLERHRDCEVVLTVDKLQIMPRSYHLPPPDLAEDQPAIDIPTEDQPPQVVPTEEPQIPTLAITAPFPIAPASYVPPEPSPPNTSATTDSLKPSTTAPPLQHISLSARDFLAIMDEVHTFSPTYASFASAHATLAKRMTRIEAAVAQTSIMLTQNQAILMQIQSHLGLPRISPSVSA